MSPPVPARRERPLDLTPVRTDDLPLTPPTDRNIPAEAWDEAPDDLLSLGDEIGRTDVLYLRRIGPWLLWRAGTGTVPRAGEPATSSRWMALHRDDVAVRYRFELRPDGTGHGDGPSGPHDRFRSWKEDLHRARS